MIFHSLDFLIFFTIVFLGYWSLSRKLQNGFLLMASYFFYCYVHPWFLILILTSTFVDYLCGLGMVRAPEKKKLFLLTSLIVNLGLLGVFKYFNFFIDNVNAILHLLGLTSFTNSLHIFLPVGISFYTFQSLSYTIDIYWGKLSPRKNIIDFALFVSFFPQLVAGPIERASRLLPQIETKRRLCPIATRNAIYLIVWGFFKKLVIADNVAATCNKIFLLANPDFALLWVGVFSFCIQIYADFSGYTDIARGIAMLLGFNLVQNFNHPYFADSPADFWRRWHMSLSFWFRDYVYIPLGGSRATVGRASYNLLFTFFLTGLWHGSNWNFIIWGMYHAALILAYRVGKTIIPKPLSKMKWALIIRIIVMFALTNIGWLIFRETDLQYLIKYFTLSPFTVTSDQLERAMYLFLLTTIYSIPLWAHYYFQNLKTYFPQTLNLENVLVPVRTIFALIMFIGILTVRSQGLVDFIYFQF